MENLIFIIFSCVAAAAVIASPVSIFKRRTVARNSYVRGEVIVLKDLHRTGFRKH